MSAAISTSPARVPPRNRWLKRLLLAGVGGLLLLLALRLAWGGRADARLAARLDALRAEGFPVSEADFALPAVHDDDNAAPLLNKAATDLVTGRSPLDIYAAGDHPAVRRRVPDLVAALLCDNAAVLDQVAAARSRPRADWGVVLTRPYINTAVPHLAGQRTLARLVYLDGVVALEGGDATRAARRLNDLLMIAARLRDGQQVLITSLVAGAVDGLAGALAVRWLCDGPVELDDATRAEFERAVASLLDEGPVRAADRRSFDVERLFISDALEMARYSPLALTAFTLPMPPPSPPRRLAGWALEPMYKLDAQRQMLRMQRYADTADTQTMTAARELVSPLPDLATDLERFSRMLAYLVSPPFDNVVRAQHLAHARRRCTAVALAARLYRADHGDWPADQAALVPAYLPRVLEDPFAAPGTPLVYERTAGGVRISVPAEEVRTAEVTYECPDSQQDQPLHQNLEDAIRAHLRGE